MPDDTPKTFSGFRRMKNSNSGKYQVLESEYRSLMQGTKGEIAVSKMAKSDIIDNSLKKSLDKILKGIPLNDREFLANLILKQSGLSSIPVKLEGVSYRGSCRIIDNNGKVNVLELKLQKDDNRRDEYKIKTVFHEFYHASSHGLNGDISKLGSLQNWAQMDDTFAECTAHYLSKYAVIDYEIMPAYPELLVNNLPKLKQLEEFKHCSTIQEFGKEFAKFRFVDSEKTAILDKYYNHCYNVSKVDIYEYAKQYNNYISTNMDEVLDKILENMPEYNNYKSNMRSDIVSAWDKIMRNNHSLSSNEKSMFNNSLIIAMNMEGVR
jgi:hypothetical protein